MVLLSLNEGVFSAEALMNNQPLPAGVGSPGEPPLLLLATFPSYFARAHLGPLPLGVRWWCTDTHPGSDCLLLPLSLVLIGCVRTRSPHKVMGKVVAGVVIALGLTPSVVI